MTARAGRRCSSIRRRPVSATSPSRRRIPASSGSGQASRTCFAPRCPASACLQVDRRGHDLPARRPDRHPDDGPYRRPSHQPRHRLRRIRRARVDRQRDARRLQDDRWREDVDQGAVPQPAHRCDRSRDESRGSRDALRGDVAARPPQVERPACRARRRRVRHHEDNRRRQDVVQCRTRDCPRRGSAAASVIDVSRSNPNVLYAFVDSYEEGRPPRDGERDAYGRPIQESRIRAAEIYRTDDQGSSWRKVSAHDDFMTQHSGTYGWVFGQIRVDPTDENTIYTMGLNLNVSRDAGKTFTTLRGMHGDHHGLWIDPGSPVGALQRQRRRVLPVGRCRQDLEVRRRRGRIAVLQRRARHQLAGLGLRIDPGRRQPPRADRSLKGTRSTFRRCSGPTPPAARDRTRRSIRPTPPSSIRTGSTATSRGRTCRRAALQVRPAAAAARAPASCRSVRRWVPGSPSSAPSGWPRSSSRRTIPRRFTPAIST